MLSALKRKLATERAKILTISTSIKLLIFVSKIVSTTFFLHKTKATVQNVYFM